jgi:hypothetical protein
VPVIVSTRDGQRQRQRKCTLTDVAHTPVFSRKGIHLVDGFWSLSRCRTLLSCILDYAASHNLPLIERREAGRSLRYHVIDGDRVVAAFPQLLELYEDVAALVRRHDPRLVPLEDSRARINVNLTPQNGEYRWHYDRNAVTAVLFLNAVSGGELEMYPQFRIHLGRFKDTSMQRILDQILRPLRRLARTVVVAPEAGRMILMRGDLCLHSVRPVRGPGMRISVVLSFDWPGVRFRAQHGLDTYLYSQEQGSARDPNYRGGWD